jgi:hypothetical protein
MDDNRPIPIDDINIIQKSICKLISGKYSGTGFFMEYKSENYVITAYHIISNNIKNIEIQIWNKKIIKLNLDNRNLILLKEKDIAAIQVKQNEIIDIHYLKFDLNFTNGYSQYNNSDIFTIGYPRNVLSTGSGKIKYIQDFEFYHTIPTDNGSAGSPIVLFNSLNVIGIHQARDVEKRFKIGIFIGELIKEINIQNNKNKNLNLRLTSFHPELGERILSINFMTLGNQDIGHYSIPCKNTQRFNFVLERLYQDFPQFRNTKLMFMLNAKPIENINKTIEEIGIKSNSIITIIQI